MKFGGYRHNYESFCEMFTCPMSINKGRTTTTQGLFKAYGNYLLYFLSLLLKIINEEIQPFEDRVDIAKG